LCFRLFYFYYGRIYGPYLLSFKFIKLYTMVPRVFVSSTYLDLKHVRQRIEKFIENYGFEPILFERDKVTYQHGKAIDQSAYYEVGLCHIMILIIGGR